ncbi:MAG: TetR/AcrR family transcriptional regulator [Solirubrobacterales bacterium]|nr:TetR/AcrR family transcriptional regulator [Solirubrobacterales bacterium]
MASEDKRAATLDDERPLRADAERNRRRLLDAAEATFCERGLEVGVGEIARRAGVGRATLFRNFPSKEHLIAAIVVERMGEATARGEQLLEAPDAGEALFEFLSDLVGRQQLDRSLFEAVADTFLANDEIRTAYEQLVAVIDRLLRRAQAVGAVRPDVGPVDVMMLFKGVCVASSTFQQIDPAIGERAMDLARAALSVAPGAPALRGRTPTLEELGRAHAAD